MYSYDGNVFCLYCGERICWENGNGYCRCTVVEEDEGVVHAILFDANQQEEDWCD